MSWQAETVFHLILVALVILAGLQDWRRREVSNWISVPLFLAGLVFAIARAFRLDVLPLLVILLLVIVWRRNWLGGADVKGLAGSGASGRLQPSGVWSPWASSD